MAFKFPASADLLELKATASVKDTLGNTSAQPIEMTFWNQRIRVAKPKTEVGGWLLPLKDKPGVDYARLVSLGEHLADDQVLTPKEMTKLLR